MKNMEDERTSKASEFIHFPSFPTWNDRHRSWCAADAE